MLLLQYKLYYINSQKKYSFQRLEKFPSYIPLRQVSASPFEKFHKTSPLYYYQWIMKYFHWRFIIYYQIGLLVFTPKGLSLSLISYYLLYNSCQSGRGIIEVYQKILIGTFHQKKYLIFLLQELSEEIHVQRISICMPRKQRLESSCPVTLININFKSFRLKHSKADNKKLRQAELLVNPYEY